MAIEIASSVALTLFFLATLFFSGIGLLALTAGKTAATFRVSSVLLASVLVFVVFGTFVHLVTQAGVQTPFVTGSGLLALSLFGAWQAKKQKVLPTLSEKLFAYAQHEKWIFPVIALLFLLKFFASLVLSDHGDAYLYHLTASETWLSSGTTGWAQENFTLGYAFALENVSFFFRTLGVTPGVQGAATQMVVGSLSTSVFALAIALPAQFFQSTSSRTISLALLCSLNGMISSWSFLAKSDMLAASLAVVVVYSAARKDALAFLLAAPSIFILKPNFAPFCVLAAFLWFWNRLPKPALVGGFLAFALAAPFLAVNALRTGNPVFPFLSSVFPSPFSPEVLSRVIYEVPKTNFSLSELSRGALTLVIHRPLTLALLMQLLLFACLLLCMKKLRLESKLLWKKALLLFTLFFFAALFTQFTSRPFLDVHSWRHHAFALIVFMGLCLNFSKAIATKLTPLVASSQHPRFFWALLSLLCLAPVFSDIKPDLNAKSIWNLGSRRAEAARVAASCCTEGGPLYADLLFRKPHFQIIHILRTELGPSAPGPLRVYSTAGNQFFGSSRVTLLAPNLSWPFYNLGQDELNPRALVNHLVSQNVQAIVLSNHPSSDQPFSLADFEACWGAPPHHELHTPRNPLPPIGYAPPWGRCALWSGAARPTTCRVIV